VIGICPRNSDVLSGVIDDAFGVPSFEIPEAAFSRLSLKVLILLEDSGASLLSRMLSMPVANFRRLRFYRKDGTSFLPVELKFSLLLASSYETFFITLLGLGSASFAGFS
jgi:hypothetical protein